LRGAFVNELMAFMPVRSEVVTGQRYESAPRGEEDKEKQAIGELRANGE
jgi:hypothetical protein